MNFNPHIMNLIAEDRIAEMHAQAESARRVRAADRQRQAAKRLAAPAKRRGFRDHVLGHSTPAQPGRWSHSHHQEKQLASVGRAGSDDCL
jgi:hypothetical protein